MDETLDEFWNGDWNRLPFMEWAGMRVLEAKDGRAVIEALVQEPHRGGGGTDAINGGFLAYMLDALFGAAVHSTWDEDVVSQVTISMNVHYLSMVRSDGIVRGESEVVKRGRTTVFAEARIFSKGGAVGVTGTGVFRLFRHGPPPAAAR